MKKILTICIVLLMILTLVGCDKSENINDNLRVQEGNFQIYRKVTVINLRSDKLLFEVQGYLSIKIDTDGDLNVTIMTGPETYKLHYISLGIGVIYVSEQLENTTSNPYHWEIIIFAMRPDVSGG